jgi:tRNA A37 methylthiotransferase MiaB
MAALSAFDPQVVGFSIRNADTALYPDSVFFLPDVADLIDSARQACDARMLIGGSALLAGPREVAAFMGCDCAVFGPGENAVLAILAEVEKGRELPAIFDGWQTGLAPDEAPERGVWIDYSPYLKGRGIAGFETQLGCRGNCGYCIEAGLPWRPRSIAAVLAELRSLGLAGCTEMHLCDCEFNQDLDFCKSLLGRIAAEDLEFNWSLYMKPWPCDSELMNLIARTGGRAITLSVDSHSLLSGVYDYRCLARFFQAARAEGIRVCVDLLIGFPGEELSQLKGIIDFLKRERPHGVGVNSWIRLYNRARLTRKILSGRPRGRIIGDDLSCLKPVFYNRLGADDCDSLIGGDPIFRIEGLERRSNYERL